VSSAEQPLLLATVNYHVGHTIPVRVAEEQGYFRDEGLTRHAFEASGLLPGPLERDGLALALTEHGVDVALGAKLAAAVYERSRGAELLIVGGWRIDGPAGTKWYGRPGRTQIASYRGGRAGIRERGSMDEDFLSSALRLQGFEAERDLHWELDPIFYANEPGIFDALLSGRVDLIPVGPNQWPLAEERGLALIVDTTTLYPAGRPGKVIVAASTTVDERADELKEVLRAIIRAFWFCRNPDNFDYVSDLDARLRAFSHNAFEHRKRLVTSREMMRGWSMPLAGAISREQLGSIIDDLAARRQLAAPLTVDDVLRDDLVSAAYRELAARPTSRADLERNRALVAQFHY